MKNILITGGAGFIGSNLSLKLIAKGYQVRVLDNLSKQIHGEVPEKTSPLYRSIIGQVEFIKGDVISRNDLELAIKDQDALIHFAAETGTGQSMYEIKKYSDINIGGTSLLLDILTNQQHSIKKIIVASSRAIYGEGKYECEKHGIVYPLERKTENMQKGDFECKCPICNGAIRLLPTSEDSKIHPSSVYGITKQNQEQMALMVGKSLGIPVVAFRYQNVYGPGQSLSNPYTGILSIFSTQIRNGNDINIFEDGKESRDFVYIDDVVNATILGLESDEANYEIFNVGADKPIDVVTVAETLRKNYNSNVPFNITGNFRLGDIRHNYADLSKIRKALNYKPQYSFEKGIKKFCNWVLKQEIQKDNYTRSIKELKEKGLYK
ncbi:NAD-dependent epimerase/dehydratase family protein [Maribellus maritimus]|uniref:NAD-dependent epimerase/dehydratase family protein n=1 Tax=Maribellus maritimus TaxID=2870838 RepID=UPI001EEAEB85|nr:NAD-dependent epimerase/dehydratase family protein [Maribellus maritimus]MCG6191224.1 NAD-dependent epimerase/dehydratase family protein [Maribellus maritimus]